MTTENPYKSYTYKFCKVEPMSAGGVTAIKGVATSIYFGVGLNGCNSEGYAEHFVKIMFPNNTWILSANPEEANKYIDKYIEDWYMNLDESFRNEFEKYATSLILNFVANQKFDENTANKLVKDIMSIFLATNY